jgi:hypothetical protein
LRSGWVWADAIDEQTAMQRAAMRRRMSNHPCG